MLPKVSGINAMAFGLALAIFSIGVGYYTQGLSHHYSVASLGLWMVLYPSLLTAEFLEGIHGQSINEQLVFIFVVQFIAGVLVYELVAFVVNSLVGRGRQ